MKRLAAFLLATFCCAAAPAADREVELAVRNALLGRADAVSVIAQDVRREEKAAKSSESIAENLRVLALSAREQAPTVSQTRSDLSSYRRDSGVRNFEALLKRHEPRQRFLEAGKDRRYEGFRRIFNGLAQPAAAAAQGQFFDLITLPFEAFDYTFIGRRFPAPEARKEIYTARAASAITPLDDIVARARRVLEKDGEGIVRLAALQAKQNGERALEQERTETALFWFEREKLLRGWERNERGGHREALRRAARERILRQEGLSIVDGDVLFASAPEFRVYTLALRGALVESREDFARHGTNYLVDYPVGGGADAVRAARAAIDWATEETQLARVHIEELAESRLPGSWPARVRQLRERPRFGPENALAAAQGEIDARWRGYLFAGSDPTVLDRSLAAEEARLQRRLWVYRARGLFLTDTLARFLSLPFVGPFPKPELLDTAARVESGFFETEEGRRWRERVMKAQRDERRFTDAAATARALGEFDRAVRYERREARRLERLADSTPSPREKIPIYRRIVNAYPTYKHIEKVRASLADAEFAVQTQATITAAELRAHPELAAGDALAISPELFDGHRRNGEIGREGVAVLAYGAYVYTDAATGRRIEVPITRDQRMNTLRRLEPLRRTGALEKALAEPGSRKKIPVALEAGVFPGFDVAPELVPLEPDQKERELYR